LAEAGQAASGHVRQLTLTGVVGPGQDGGILLHQAGCGGRVQHQFSRFAVGGEAHHGAPLVVDEGRARPTGIELRPLAGGENGQLTTAQFEQYGLLVEGTQADRAVLRHGRRRAFADVQAPAVVHQPIQGAKRRDTEGDGLGP